MSTWRSLELVRNSGNTCLSLQVELADSFFARARGLMLRPRLPVEQGLLLTDCSSIHMCFMRFAIDAVYLDRELRILKVVRNLRPWLGLSACRGAWAVLELTAGAAARHGYIPGQQLRLRG